MTSANVTYYYVYRGKELILKTSQHCLCKDNVRWRLREIEKPEECKLICIWPDENEVDQEVFNGPLTKKLAQYDAEDARIKKTQAHYAEMKRRGTVACLCRANELEGKYFISDEGVKMKMTGTYGIHKDIVLQNEIGKMVLDKGTFGLNWTATEA